MSFFSPQPPLLQTPPPQQTPFHFQQPPPQQQQQLQTSQFQLPQQTPQQQQQGQQLLLFTKEKSPAGWGTKWDDLHPDSQKLLLQIEERTREYRDESERLDQCSRLYDSSVSNDTFELDATRIVQEIRGTNTAIEREKALIQELTTKVKDMMRDTELAVHSYTLLKPRFVRTPNAAGPANQIVPAVPAAPAYDFYSGVPKRPSAFIQSTVARLEKYLEECVKWIEEVEQLVQMDFGKKYSDSLESLPKVMSNVHDYFIYVASKVENLHQYIESMKTAYLTDQRRHGDGTDPFLEASRREAARQEAAAKRVHPTLHLPATPHSTTQLTPTLPTQSLPATSAFNTPAPAPSGSGFLFSTPMTSAAASSALFTPAQSTPLFGSTPAQSMFGSSPAIGGASLFSTPGFGAVTGSGASFGGTSKASRPKSRTARR